MDLFDVNGLEVGQTHVTHDILHSVVFIIQMLANKDTLEHVHNAADRTDGHLLAHGPCDDEFPRGEEKPCGFWIVDADGDGRKTLAVVRAVGNRLSNRNKIQFPRYTFDVCG